MIPSSRGSSTELDSQLLDVLAGRPGRGWLPLTPAAVGMAVADEPLRQAARRLAEQGRVELGSRGRVLDPTAARGAVDVRLCRTSGGR